MRYTPTEEQKEVLKAQDNILVIGLPGSGKTTIALEKARLFLAEREQQLAASQRVLFLSFSNAAVERIRSAARVNLLRTVRRQLEITTFHAFCYDFLRSHWRLAGLHEAFRLYPPEDEAVLKSLIPERRERAERLRSLEIQEGRVRFSRFAKLTCRVLDRVSAVHEAYASAYPLVVADEYQDTSDDQHQLVQLLRHAGQLVCLGDPQQRIYDWDKRSGSRADRLERLEDQGLRKVTLTSNHRSGDIDVLDVARAVLEGRRRIPRPSSVRVRRYRDHGHLEEVLKQEVIGIERSVRKSRGNGRVTLAIMAFPNSFVRALSRMLSNVGGGFRYPFQHQVLIQPEAVGFAWGAMMGALAASSAEGRACCLLIGAAKLKRMNGGKTAVRSAERLERWADKITTGTLSGRARGAKSLVEELQSLPKWTGVPEDDVHRLSSVLSGIPGGHLDGIRDILSLKPLDDPSSELPRRLADSYSEAGDYQRAPQHADEVLLRERLEVALDRGPPRLVMTLHKCKGKEFDGVIIVNGRYGDSLLIPGDKAPGFPRSRRLLHVGLTRAIYGARLLTPFGEECSIWPGFA